MPVAFHPYHMDNNGPLKSLVFIRDDISFHQKKTSADLIFVVS